jgi:tRNA/tmRNA/rRNA uracil-C5-methylase (TrmA/RlmC/RlmD family)
MASFLELSIDRPVAGGRMLARHDGQVVFVQGAIPGERVRARIERRQKQVLFAEAVEVLDASPDRREPHCDISCGGSNFAHVKYERQLALKGEIVSDAFGRIAKHPLPAAVPVAASPEFGYRLRAHVRAERGTWGFFRENTHRLCDGRATRQLSDECAAAIDDVVTRYPAASSIVVSESIDGTARGFLIDDTIAAGDGLIRDTAASLFRGTPPIDLAVTWIRRPASFFQGNRFLVGDLVSAVMDGVPPSAHVIDLYAGGGLFSVALAARGSSVVAIESDVSGAADLRDNARPFRDRLRAIQARVEDAVSKPPGAAPDVVIVDPPRVGMSAEALAGLVTWAPSSILYVSCDPPTLARDAGRLFAAGYSLTSLRAFDLFPNTAHVEVLAAFGR